MEQITEKLDKGLPDFVELAKKPDAGKYECSGFPDADVWELAFPEDDLPAQKETITVNDLIGLPLLCLEQSRQNEISVWCGDLIRRLRLEGSLRLSYNGSLFAREGLGYLLTFDHLVSTSPDSGRVFRPLFPRLETTLYLIWKRYQTFSPMAERFLRHLRTSFVPQQNERVSGEESSGIPD